MSPNKQTTRSNTLSKARRGNLQPVNADYSVRAETRKDEFARAAASRAICRYLKVSVWESDDMYALPAKGQSRLVFLYLMTGPHTLSLHVPGLYSIGPQALKERLAMSGQQFAQAIATLQSAVGLKTDFARCLIWMPSALKHMGPPANPNIVRSYCRGLQLAPKSELREEAIQSYAPFLAGLGHHLLKPFAECFPMVCQTLSKPFRIEKEKEREREREMAGGDARSVEGARGSTSSPASPEENNNYDIGLRHIADILKTLG